MYRSHKVIRNYHLKCGLFVKKILRDNLTRTNESRFNRAILMSRNCTQICTKHILILYDYSVPLITQWKNYPYFLAFSLLSFSFNIPYLTWSNWF